MDIAGEHQVVVGHEIEGVGVDDGEDAGGEFVDAFGSQITVERQLRRGEFIDAAVDALAERGFRRLPEKQCLVPV